MNECSQNESDMIRSKINDPKKKLFLNEEDLFDPKNWVAGRELVLGLKDNMKEVKKCLLPYKDLLLVAGIRELKDIKSNVKNVEGDQKNVLIDALLKKLTSNSGNDVIFIVSKEKARICANKYVLLGTLKIFL